MKVMKADELKKKLDKNEVLLIDVRELDEYKAECIHGSCHIPLGSISSEKLPSKTNTIVIHCRSGKRSEEACKRLLAENPDLDISVLEGGIMAWKEAGFPVKSSDRHMIPLDRQVQIVAGILVTFGVIFGSLVNPLFYGLAGFVGLGLIFAGMSGWCGMAKLLSKMPWNRFS